jgi:uncharacterized protein (DUF302 family)
MSLVRRNRPSLAFRCATRSTMYPRGSSACRWPVKWARAAAAPAVRASLAEEGFGVLTEIDVAHTLATKIGVEREPLKILGACNPQFAHRALEMDISISLLLPCNVVLAQTDGGTHVSAVDPRALMDSDEFNELASDAAARLTRAIEALPSA